jgi:hypothetical protein
MVRSNMNLYDVKSPQSDAKFHSNGYKSKLCNGHTVSFETGFPFWRLLRLAGTRWRYSNQPPRWWEVWEEFVAYSSRYDTDRRENDESNDSSIVKMYSFAQ